MRTFSWIGHGALGALALAFGVGCSGSDTGSPGSSGSSGAPAATTDSPEGAALFEPPSSTKATPDSIFGTWGGSADDGGITFDIRMHFEKSSMTLAGRCSREPDGTTPIVSATVSARVSNDGISILESKENVSTNGKIACRVHPTPIEWKPCPTDDFAQPKKCFDLSGTSLSFYGDTPLEKSTLTKLTD